MIRTKINTKKFLKNMKNNIKNLENYLKTEGDIDKIVFLTAEIEARKILLEKNILDIESFEECYANELAIYSFILGNNTEESYNDFFVKNYQMYININK